MQMQASISEDGITVTTVTEKRGFLSRLVSRAEASVNLQQPRDRVVAIALADLRSAADELGEELQLSDDSLRLSHRLASALDNDTAAVFGLPNYTDYILEADVKSHIGRPDFRITTRWLRNGQPYSATRRGAFVGAAGAEQRIPLWMFDALEAIDPPMPADDARQWERLAHFRKAVEAGQKQAVVGVSLSGFLESLKVDLTDGFSIHPNDDGDDFEVLPFSADRADDSEAAAELQGPALIGFQRKLRERGALNAFSLGAGHFMVVAPRAKVALQVMAQMQRAPVAERAAFVRNPRDRIQRAVEAQLLLDTDYRALDPAAQQEVLEAQVGPLFVETVEYAGRVSGIAAHTPEPEVDLPGSGTIWYPKEFSDALRERLADMSGPQLLDLAGRVIATMAMGRDEDLTFEGQVIPASQVALDVLAAHYDRLEPQGDTADPDAAPAGPIVIQTQDNLEEVTWAGLLRPRSTAIPERVPDTITTSLKPHQLDSFAWATAAWRAGLPGVLNADEQGLGKTLQTISFLVWLNAHMSAASDGRPILVVAPTSLLRNWEEEVTRHVSEPGLGQLVRLYGTATAGHRKTGELGHELEDAAQKLDLIDLQRCLNARGAAPAWLLTTYATLTNYQHSLAQIPFAAVVFDEIQNLKNPTLAAGAARAVNADFRIGLTGTPIENAAKDLWAVMDQLAPGALGSLRDFTRTYGSPDEDNMSRLYRLVFKGQGHVPPLALRRLKTDVARDLPAKTRLLHPRLMPPDQARRYDEARLELARGGRSSALKMLQHIRSVSAHPAVEDRMSAEDYIAASARLEATFSILRQIRERGERALVFVEQRKLQYRLIELARLEFGLRRIDLINGDTPIVKRQAIVNRFQTQIGAKGFDLLVLGPKAAGTGLTLTAATHVIHVTRWWNPAVEEQCNDRVHRIGQTSPVTVHIPLAVHPVLGGQSFDVLLHGLMERKRRLASAALWPMGETGEEAAELQRSLQAERPTSGQDPLNEAMSALFGSTKAAPIARGADGSWVYG